MRTFHIDASEYVDEKSGTPHVNLLITDKDSGTAVRIECPYGPGSGNTRSMAYDITKEIAGHRIRQRLADESVNMKVPEGCPNKCHKGYLTDEAKVRLCNNPECMEYSSNVIDIANKILVTVTYNPGTHDDTSFRL